MNQRIAVDAFKRRAGQKRGLAPDPEHGGAFDHQERPQPLSPAEAGITHRLDQPFRPRDLVGQKRIRQELPKQGFGILRGLVQSRCKV
jgi:hypothetical protein